MNTIVGLKELREHMGEYVAAVGKGKSFTVVRRSRPIFKITPVDAWGDEGVWETVADLSKNKKGGISAAEVLKYMKEHGFDR